MNKKEIIEFIEYKGNYTKQVKTKLNKLIKKYHPDKQKDDKETILLLYEIKKDLEKGNKIEFKETKNETTSNNEVNESFIERIINVLKQRKDFIEKELQKLYKKSYYYSNKIYEESYTKGLLDIRREEIINSINNLKKIDIIDFIIFSIFIIIILISRIINNNYLLIFIMFPILFEIYYYGTKKVLIEKTKVLLSKVESERNIYIENENEYNKIINDLKKEEVSLEKEIRKVNDDIAYYNHELNRVNNKEYQKENDLHKQRIKK